MLADRRLDWRGYFEIPYGSGRSQVGGDGDTVRSFKRRTFIEHLVLNADRKRRAGHRKLGPVARLMDAHEVDQDLSPAES